MEAGHGLIGTGGTLADGTLSMSGGMGPNMKKLAPLFGLVERSMYWDMYSPGGIFSTNAFTHPVMTGMPFLWHADSTGLLSYDRWVGPGKATQLAYNEWNPFAILSAYETTAVGARYNISYYGWDIDGDEVDDLFGPTPSLIFPDAGEFDVTLTIIDEAGHTASDTVHITVLAVNPTVDAGSDQGGSEGTLLSFQGTIVEPGAGGPYTIEWDFGDGTTTSGTLTPTHTYADNGTYTVTLTVTDANGGVGSDTLQVTVTDVGPSAAFSWAPEPQDEGAAVQFTDASISSPDAIVSWSWGFAGLGASTLQNPSFTFLDHGTYTVTLTVTDDDGSTDTISHDITIADLAPSAAFSWAPEPQDEGAAVQFTDHSTSSPDAIASWSWDFAGLDTSTEQHPSFTFLDDGIYSITLTVTDDDGSTHTISHDITITDLAPSAAFTWAPEPQDEGSPVQFTDASTSSPDAIVSWSWDLAGLGTSTLQNPSFTFLDDGIYSITLTVTDDDGSTHTISHDITITDLAPSAAFTWAPEPQDEGSPVQFTDASTSFPDTIVSWSWDFAGLGTSSDQDPSFTFMDDGTYSVTLTVTDDDGSADTISHDISILDLTPIAAFTWAPEPQDEGAPVQFTDASTSFPDAIVSWAWDFDGIGTSSEQNPSFTFMDDGTYTVTLTVTDDDGSTDTVIHTITINNVAPSVDAGADQTVNEGDSASLDPATFADAGMGDTHTAVIDWGDGTPVEIGVITETGGFGTVSGSHVYVDNGAYTITVTVTDDDGAATADTLMITVLNVAPSVNAGADQTVNEGELVSLDPATFTDVGTADTHTAVIDWGDGTVEIGAIIEAGGVGTVSGSHVYADNGIYIVTVTVTDDDGAATADTLMITVLNVAPFVEAGTDQTVNEGDLVSLDPAAFTDAGTGDTHTAVIDWGDGTVEIGVVTEADGYGTVSGSHVYADNGAYTVTVTVTDDDGAATADTLIITILNVAPSANAGADQTINEGELVSLDPATFTDVGTADTHTAVIDWGDGTVEIGAIIEAGGVGTVSGSHAYADNGAYTVTVTVIDDDGASSSDTLTLTVLNVAPSVEAGVHQTVNEGELVTLDPATFTDAGTADTHTAVIDWGDGTPVEIGVVAETDGSGTVSGSHVYADNGAYTVTVTVTDDDGASSSDTLTLTVLNVAPSVEAGVHQTVNEGDSVALDPAAFTDAGTADTHYAIIDWGDGTVEIGVVTETDGSGTVSGSHAYTDNGAYTVTVTVTDDDGAATADTLMITVLNVAPSVEAGTDQTVDEGALVSFSGIFTDPGADTHTVHWDFGDGTNAAGTLIPEHIYADDGVYTVTLTVTDDDGGVGTDTLTMTVLNVAPTASIDAIEQLQVFALPELTVLILDPVTFEGSATDPGADTFTYYWTFGDGEGASGSSTTHSYGVPDTYPVTLTVTDDDGGVGTASVMLTVWGPQDLKASVISDLGALKTGEWWVDKRLDRVIWYVEQSLNEKFWLNETHLHSWYGWRVFFYELLAEIHLEIRAKLYSYFISMLEHWIECWQAKGY
ncbi:MAG: PKD domain-containing protein, partial [Candidatus Hodarchaeales archaeon]